LLSVLLVHKIVGLEGRQLVDGALIVGVRQEEDKGEEEGQGVVGWGDEGGGRVFLN
jgi:hypothetical protein